MHIYVIYVHIYVSQYTYILFHALYVFMPSLLLQTKEQMAQQRQLVAISPCSVQLALHSSSHLHY